jgi:hypothetical protein
MFRSVATDVEDGWVEDLFFEGGTHLLLVEGRWVILFPSGQVTGCLVVDAE